MVTGFLGSVMFFEAEELQTLAGVFSDRLRRDPSLAPALRCLVGNHWAAAESAFEDFFKSQLFGDALAHIDRVELERVISLLDGATIDRIVEILLESALQCLPLHSAARVDAVSEDLGRLLKMPLRHEGEARSELIQQIGARLSAGALQNSL
jgi:hypothetical protein